MMMMTVTLPMVFGCGLRASISHVNVGEAEVDTAGARW